MCFVTLVVEYDVREDMGEDNVRDEDDTNERLTSNRGQNRETETIELIEDLSEAMEETISKGRRYIQSSCTLDYIYEHPGSQPECKDDQARFHPSRHPHKKQKRTAKDSAERYRKQKDTRVMRRESGRVQCKGLSSQN